MNLIPRSAQSSAIWKVDRRRGRLGLLSSPSTRRANGCCTEQALCDASVGAREALGIVTATAPAELSGRARVWRLTVACPGVLIVVSSMPPWKPVHSNSTHLDRRRFTHWRWRASCCPPEHSVTDTGVAAQC